jgi:hypothetical protein
MAEERTGVAAPAEQRTRIKPKSVGVGSILLGCLFVVLSRDPSSHGVLGPFAFGAAIVLSALGAAVYAGKRQAVIALRALYLLMLILTFLISVAGYFLEGVYEGEGAAVRSMEFIVLCTMLLAWMSYSVFVLRAETA